MVRLRDGMWMEAENVQVQYAEDIYEITPQEDGQGLSLLCPTKHIRSRGDTLNQPTITLVRNLGSRPRELSRCSSAAGCQS